MAAKPAIAAEAKITEKSQNIAKDVGDHLTTTTEKAVENSALKTGDTHPEKEVEGVDEKSELAGALKEMFGSDAGVEAELSALA